MRILEIKELKKGKLLVRADEVGTFPVYAKEAASYAIAEGAELSDDDWTRLCAEVLSKRVKSRALHLLEQRDYTEAQLRRKLKENQYPDSLIEEAVSYVASFHYIDDLRYAQNYVRFHQDGKSRMQIKNTLLSRGVSAERIEQALEECYEADEGEVIARLLFKRGYDPKTADQRERNRTFQYLCRKGFPASEVKRRMDLT